MPLTFVHPAAVLPLVAAARKLRLDATCLIAGAMAPDFGYFVRGRLYSGNSHTVLGLFTWSLPTTIVIALLFHRLVKWPMLMALPTTIARRLVPAIAADWPPARAAWSFWPLAIISTLIGAISHLAWDSATHAEGWLVLRVPALLVPVHVPIIGTIPLCRVLQHASTLLGAIVVAIWLWRRTWPAAVALPAVARRGARWSAVIAIAIGVALAYVHLRMRMWRGYADAGDWVVATITGTLAGVLVASWMWYRAAAAWRDEVSRTLGV